MNPSEKIFLTLAAVALLSMCPGNVHVCAQPAQPETDVEAGTGTGEDASGVKINFQDMDIDMVLKFYSELTGLTVIKSEQVRGKVTVISPVKLPREDAIRIIEAVLEMRGFTMVKSKEIAKVVSQKEAVQKAIDTNVIPEDISDSMITQIVPLSFVEAVTVANDFRPLVSPSGTIFASERTNSVVIIDTASNIKRLIDILNELDVEIFKKEIQVRVIQLLYSDVEDMAELLGKIFTGERATAETARAYTRYARPSARAQQPPEAEKEAFEELAGKIKIFPYERLHALVVVTASGYYRIVEELITKLDIEGPEVEESTRVYYIQNAQAKDLQPVLTSLFTGIVEEQQKEGQPVVRRRYTREETVEEQASTVLKGKITVVAEDRTNSLLITSHASNFLIVDKLIKKLDIRTPEVLIEALIAEVTLDDQTKYGLEYMGKTTAFDPESIGRIGWGLQDFSPPTVSSTAASGFKYWVMNQDQTLGAFLWLLSTESQVNILARPKILATNNQEAKIIIGEEVPVVTESRVLFEEASTPSYQAIEYKDIAIELTVKPRINQDREVALEIHQIVKKVGSFDQNLNAFSFVKREAKTTAVVADGQTMVIGGLIKDDKNNSIAKIPVFGDMPVVGKFFRKQETKIEKTELMIFITPHVITSAKEGEEVSSRQEAEISVPKTPRKEKARECYEKAEEFYKLKDYEKAVNWWEKALEVSPGYLDTEERLEKARKKASEKRENELGQEKKKQDSITERIAGERIKNGDRLEKQGQYAEAISEWRKALLVDPDNKAAMSRIRAAKSKVEGVAGDESKETPDDEEVKQELMDFAAKKKPKEDVQKELLREKVVSELTERGIRHYGAGEYGKAIADFEQALLIDEDNAQARRYIELSKEKLK